MLLKDLSNNNIKILLVISTSFIHNLISFILKSVRICGHFLFSQNKNINSMLFKSQQI